MALAPIGFKKKPEVKKEVPKPPKPKEVAAAKKAKAETARTKAKEAQVKAQKSEKTAAAARTERKGAKEKLDKAVTVQAKAMSPGAQAEAKPKVEKADKEFKKADKASTEANAQAAKDKKEAITAANKALAAEKEANDAAEKAKLPKPYALADKQKDAFDAGSLSAADQTKLFGTRSVVSPKEAAQADSKRVAEATGRSPKAGSEELARQLKAGSDPAYRKALVKESEPQLGKMADAAGDKKTPAEDRNAIVKNLADSASLSGPEGKKTIAGKLNEVKDQGTLLDGFKANSKDAKTVALGAEMARQQRASFNYEKADAIANASPALKKAAAESPLDTALRKEVDLKTVKEERAGVQGELKQTQAAVKARAEALEKLADDPSKLPPGVSVKRDPLTKDPTFETKDKEGNITERTTVNTPYGGLLSPALTPQGNRDTAINTQRFDHKTGKVELESTNVSEDGKSVSTSSTRFTAKDVSAASKATGPGELAKLSKADPKAKSASRQLSYNDEGNLVDRTRTQDAKSGITETTKTYSTQKGEDGLNDQLKGKFDDKKPIDKVDVTTVNIPPEGTKTPDGKLAEATYTAGTSYSQGDVRATASESRSVSLPTKYPGRQEFTSGASTPEGDVAYRGRKEKADSPKTWTLEASKPGELNKQTFIEGREDISVTSRKKLEGNTLTETTSGTVPNPKDPDGKPVSIQGKETRTYDNKGQVTAQRLDKTDADGTRTVQDYKRSEKRDDKGQLVVTERTTGARTPKDGATVNTSSTLSRTFNSKDQVVAAHLEQTDEKGTKLTQDYQRSEKRNAQGELEIAENTKTVTEAKDGEKATLEQEQVSAQTKNGPELISAMSKVTNKDGTAQHTLTPKGQELTVNGKKVDSQDAFEGLPKAQASLGSAAMDGVSQQVQDFNELARAMDADKPLTPIQQERNNVKELSAAASANNVGLLRLKETLTPALKNPEAKPLVSIKGANAYVGRLGGLASVAGGAEILSKAGPLFMKDLSQGNYLKAAADAGAIAGGTIGVAGGANSVLTGLRGKGTGLSLDGGVLKKAFGTPQNTATALNAWAKVSVGLGVFSGGMQVKQGIEQDNGWAVASGVTTAGAAVGGYLAAGAAAGAWGGPAGAGVGLAVGLAAWGMTKVFDHFDRSEYTIARPRI